MEADACRVVVTLADGTPAGTDDLSRAMPVDPEGLPLGCFRPRVRDGQVTLPLPATTFGITLPLPVAGFGNVYVTADADGSGYRPDELVGRTLDFVPAAASSRLAAVRRKAAELAAEEGITVPPAVVDLLAAGAEHLHAARRGDPAAAHRALAAGLHAGETLVVAAGTIRGERLGRRPGFRFGANAFGFGQGRSAYEEAFTRVFDLGTVPVYRRNTEAVHGRRDWKHLDRILTGLAARGIAAKGHPLVWLNKSGWPAWAAALDWDGIRDDTRRYIRETVSRYRDRIHLWDVINEGHDWANDPRLSPAQMVELTRLAAEETGAADPGAERVVNSCCTWSEYVNWGCCSSGDLGRTPVTVLGYLRSVLAAGVPFEVVGVQMYYPYRDLFEIDRHLDLFCALGKPVHITELGVPSADALRDRPNEDIALPVRPWHGGGWDEATQADWLEGYYRICYGKPAITAISWWDFGEPAWYPHGGLLRPDHRPKPAYDRLAALIAGWRPVAGC
jgi:GH35 family endo-1,4-beta-xylanase